MIEKHCSHCNQTKPISEFGRDRRQPGGIAQYCRQCRHEQYTKTYRGALSLQAGYWHRESDRKLVETLAYQRRVTDPTYERVFKALAIWIQERTLTLAEAEAIYLYAVERFTFGEIGILLGCKSQTPHETYHRGIAKLRARYKEVIAS